MKNFAATTIFTEALALANGVFGMVPPVLFLGSVLTARSLWKPNTHAQTISK